MIRVLAAVFVILTFIGCRQPAALTEEEKASIREEVKQTLNNYFNDVRTSGLTTEFNYLDNSAEFFWVPPGYSGAISYDSVSVLLKQAAPKYSVINNSFNTLQIVPLSNELATYTGRITSIMIDTSGEYVCYQLIETGTVIKRNNSWKLLSGHTSLAPNPDFLP